MSQFKQIMDKVAKDEKTKNKPIPFVIVRDGFQMMVATTLDFSTTDDKNKKNK